MRANPSYQMNYNILRSCLTNTLPPLLLVRLYLYKSSYQRPFLRPLSLHSKEINNMNKYIYKSKKNIQIYLHLKILDQLRRKTFLLI